MAEDLVLEQDLLDHLLRAAHEVRAVQRRPGLVLLARQRRPPALSPDRVHHLRDVGERLVERLLRSLRDVAVRVDAEGRERVVPRLVRGVAVQLRERREPLRKPADDRERHRQPECARAERRLGRASHRDPDRQRVLHRARIHADATVDRRAMLPLPLDAIRFAQREQHPQLLLEQLVVVLEVVAEQRERLGERPAAGHDLGAAAREQIDRGEILEHPDGIVGADHRDRAREPDARRCERPRPPARRPAPTRSGRAGDVPRCRRRRVRADRRARPPP